MRKLNFSFCFILFISGISFAFVFASSAAGFSVPERIDSRETREVRVYLKTQCFGFYEKGRLVFFGSVCTGKRGCETPRGKFRILMKAKGYVSKKFGSPMPFALQFSTGGHFLHQGEVCRYPASHGCVRLTMEDAKQIFGLLKIHDPVTVTD